VAHVEVGDGPGDVELVYGGDDDGGRGEEGEQDHQEDVEQEEAKPPADALHREVLPETERKGNTL